MSKNSSDSYPQLKKELLSGNIRPVYLISGEETFFVDAIQKDIMKLIPDDLKDFNLDIFYGSETSVNKVINAAKSFPMMSEKRVVVVREFSVLFDKVKSESDQTDDGSGSGENAIEDLISYINAPNPQTILVLTDKKPPPGNTKLGKAFASSKYAITAHFDPLPETTLPDWIIKWSDYKFGRKIDHEAAYELYTRTGSDLLLITTELEKLNNFKSDDESIKISDVKETVRVTREVGIFDLKDVILKRDTARAISMVLRILRSNPNNEVGELLKLIGFFYSYFSNLWAIKRLMARGLPHVEIKKRTGIKSDFYFNNLVRESNVYNIERLHFIMESILDADRAVKGFSKMSNQDIASMFIKRIIP